MKVRANERSVVDKVRESREWEGEGSKGKQGKRK